MININYEHLIEQIELMKTQAQVLHASFDKNNHQHIYGRRFSEELIGNLDRVVISYKTLMKIQIHERPQKFKIGQAVFYEYEGAIHESTVVSYDCFDNTYDLDDYLHVPESDLFKTKKEAIQHQLSHWAKLASEYAEECNNPNNPDQ